MNFESEVPLKYADSPEQEDSFDQNGDGEEDNKVTKERNYSNLRWSSRTDANKHFDEEVGMIES